MSATQPQVTLTWANKHTPAPPTPAELTLRETFAPFGGTAPHEGVRGRTRACGLDEETASPAHNAIYYGDNLPALARLLVDGWAGRFRLIYADPPYNSGGQWMRKVKLRGPRSKGRGASVQAIVEQQPQYEDAWDENVYLQFLYERLPLLRDLLAEDGSL